MMRFGSAYPFAMCICMGFFVTRRVRSFRNPWETHRIHLRYSISLAPMEHASVFSISLLPVRILFLPNSGWRSGAIFATNCGMACRFRQLSGPVLDNSSLESILGRLHWDLCDSFDHWIPGRNGQDDEGSGAAIHSIRSSTDNSGPSHFLLGGLLRLVSGSFQGKNAE